MSPSPNKREFNGFWLWIIIDFYTEAITLRTYSCEADIFQDFYFSYKFYNFPNFPKKMAFISTQTFHFRGLWNAEKLTFSLNVI